MKRPSSGIYANAGASLRRLRKEKGFTLDELSERAEISLSYLSHIERGTRQAPLTTLETLARILGINLYDLFQPLKPARPAARESRSAFDAKIAGLLPALSEGQKKNLHGLMKEMRRKNR
ncbi:MAG TPA: helix-turn-helix transcriptional regulator [bacterium]|nr:helix-turn-helix transcriptional regulator [bacterium]